MAFHSPLQPPTTPQLYDSTEAPQTDTGAPQRDEAECRCLWCIGAQDCAAASPTKTALFDSDIPLTRPKWPHMTTFPPRNKILCIQQRLPQTQHAPTQQAPQRISARSNKVAKDERTVRGILHFVIRYCDLCTQERIDGRGYHSERTRAKARASKGTGTICKRGIQSGLKCGDLCLFWHLENKRIDA